MKKGFFAFTVLAGLTGTLLASPCRAENKELGFNLLVTFHQPLSTRNGKMLEYPWARLSAIQIDNLLGVLERYPNVKLSLSLSPTLLKQIALIANGIQDPLYLAATTPFSNASSEQCERLQWAWGPKAGEELRHWAKNPEWLLANESDGEQSVSIRKHETDLKRLLPRIKALSNRGQLELLTTPYAHPILSTLPENEAKDQISKGLRVFHATFKTGPKGLLPPGGFLTSKQLGLLKGYGFRWFASTEEGQGIQADSLVPYQTPGGPAVFFQERKLANVLQERATGTESAKNVLSQLEELSHTNKQTHPITTLVIDGADLAHQGQPFLETLFQGLSHTEGIRSVLPSEYLSHYSIPSLGRWNSRKPAMTGYYEEQALHVLETVRQKIQVSKHPRLSQAQEMLALAESTDWMQWYQREANAQPGSDEIFRSYLRSALVFIGERIPPELMRPILPPYVIPAWSPKADFTPHIDGELKEWKQSGRIKEAALQMEYGKDQKNLNLGFTFPKRVIPFFKISIGVLGRPEGRRISNIPFDCHYQAELSLGGGDLRSLSNQRSIELKAAAKQRTLEMLIPWKALGLSKGDEIYVMATLPNNKAFPRHPLKLTAP